MDVVTISVSDSTPICEIQKFIEVAIRARNTRHIEIIIGSKIRSFNQELHDQRMSHEMEIIRIKSELSNGGKNNGIGSDYSNFNPHAKPGGGVYSRD